VRFLLLARDVRLDVRVLTCWSDLSTLELRSSLAAAAVGGLLVVVALALALALEEEEDGAYLFDKLDKMDARDSARSMACLVAAEDMMRPHGRRSTVDEWLHRCRAARRDRRTALMGLGLPTFGARAEKS